jgi:chromosome segregation ATPase
LKIHFLEEALKKAGPDFNQAALKENTELKVFKITMQKELHRYRKSLNQAEQDLEQYRMHLAEMQEKARRKYMDEGVKEEIERLKKEVEAKETLVEELREKLNEAEEVKKDEFDKLRDDIGDLEAELREKERSLDDKDDEIEVLKASAGKDSNDAKELEEELESAKKDIAELQEDLERANATAQEAIQEKKNAEEDLNELRDEMANKSFHTKGLSRQLEEKASKQEDELNRLRKEHNELKERFEEKSRQEKRLGERIQELGQDTQADKAKFQDDLELARHERDTAKRNFDQISSRLQQALTDARNISEQKDLLQTRHDALTNESRGLQKDLAKAEATIGELEQAVEDERQLALNNDRSLRAHHTSEVQRLAEQIDDLNRQVEDLEGEFAVDRDHWESDRRRLESEKQKAEEKASGLSRTVAKLQEAEGTLSGRELRIQEALESEKLRHRQEEEVLNRQVKELNEDVVSRRLNQEELRVELLKVREQLRIQKREETNLHEKIQGLEDEIEVLQSTLDEEAEHAKEQLAKGQSDVHRQLQNALSDKQTLRGQLADLNIQLASLQASAAQSTVDKDELNLQLQEMQKRLDDTLRHGQEKSELRVAKLRLSSEVDNLKEEKARLLTTIKTLRNEQVAEIERAAAAEGQLVGEIETLKAELAHRTEGRDKDLLSAKSKIRRLETRIKELENRLVEQTKQAQPNEGRDRELVSAKSRAHRLEIRLQELENRLLEQHTIADTSVLEISTLHDDLVESRKKEVKATMQQSKLQQTVRALKSNVSALEHQIQDLHTTKASRDGAARQLELESFRQELDQAHQTVRELRAKNRELEREAITEEERKDLHSLLKSSKLETESISLRLSDREAKIDTLRAQLKRVRDERGHQAKKAEAAARELDTLQSELEGLYTRYESCLEDMAGLQNDWDGERKALLRAATSEGDKRKHEKELKGLAQEIQWIRVKLEREKAFRQSLAWSKGYLGEEIRVRKAWSVYMFPKDLGSHANTFPYNSNEANLGLIAKMGVHAPKLLQKNKPSKLKAAVLMVQAVVRLQRLSSAWREVKQVGDVLQRAKSLKTTASAPKEKRQRTPVRDVEKKRSGKWREV